MAIRRINKQQSAEIPAAELYLDDVEAIVAILSSTDPEIVDQATTEPPQIKFVIGEREFDSIDDLRNFGGSTARLTIESRGLSNAWSYDWLKINRFDTSFYGNSARGPKIRDVFMQNSLWWPNVVRSMPGWLSFLLWLYVSTVWMVMGSLQKYPQVEGILTALSILIVIGGFFAYYRHSIIHLRYSHEGGMRQWARTHSSEIVIAIASALIGSLVTLLFDVLKKHFWQ